MIRKLLVLALVLALFSMPAFAQNAVRVDAAGNVDISMTPAKAAGYSQWYDIYNYGITSHRLSYRVNGTPASFTLTLECSNTGSDTATSVVGTGTTVTGGAITATATPCTRVRWHLSALSGTATIYLTYHGGFDSAGVAASVAVDSIAAGDNNIGNVDVVTVPADPFGANADASVAAGATGSIQAKLRRLTQGVEDLKTLIVVAAGANQIGTVLIKDSAGTAITATTDDCSGTIPTRKRYISVGSTEDESQVKATAGTLCSIEASNAHASANAFIKCTNLTAANTTPGSSAIFYDIMVPFGLTVVDSHINLPFDTALTCYIVLGKTDAAVDEVAADDVRYVLRYR